MTGMEVQRNTDGDTPSNFDRELPSTPSVSFAKIQELCVLCLLHPVASSHLVSHGTASSMKISFLPDFDYTSMSGRRVVSTISGKTILFPKSTPMFQPGVSPRIDEPTLRFCNVDCAVCVLHTLRFCNVGCAVCFLLVLPDLTKAICRCWGLLPCPFSHSFSSQSANSLRTESCLHLYLPCVSAVEQDDRTCSSVSGLSHRLHLGSAVSLQLHRFAGDGSRS